MICGVDGMIYAFLVSILCLFLISLQAAQIAPFVGAIWAAQQYHFF